MSFVRKPRPYSSGLPTFPVPSEPLAPSPKSKAAPRVRPERGARSAWATAVTALAVLGTVALLLVGGTGLVNQLWRDAQFRSAAVGITDVQR